MCQMYSTKLRNKVHLYLLMYLSIYNMEATRSIRAPKQPRLHPESFRASGLGQVAVSRQAGLVWKLSNCRISLTYTCTHRAQKNKTHINPSYSPGSDQGKIEPCEQQQQQIIMYQNTSMSATQTRQLSWTDRLN